MVETLKANSLTKNTVYLTLASLSQKILSFVYYFYLAHQLQPEGLGKYTFVLSFTSIFIIFMDFGLGPIFTREGAKSKEELQNYFQNTVSLKIILTILSLLVMFLTILGMHFYSGALFGIKNISSYDVWLVCIGGVVIILDTFTFTFYSVFRALKQLKYEALGVFCYQALIVILGGIFLYFNLSLGYIIGALILGSSFNFIFFITLLRKKTDLRFHFSLQKKWVKKLLTMAVPFAIAGIFVRLSGTVDSILLKTLAGDRFVGWYGLAYKLTFALTVLPGSFATGYFPEVSYYFKHQLDQVKTLFEKGSFYMFLLSLPLSIGVMVLAHKVIYTIWGPAWEASVRSLQILAASILFIFLNYPIGNLLNACNKQLVNTLNTGIALVINVLLNLWLIPKYTYLGASAAAFISSACLVLLGLPWVYKLVKFNVRYLIIRLIKTGFSALVMGVILYTLRVNINLIFLIGIGIFSYISMLLIVKAINFQDLKPIWLKIIKRRS